MTREDYFVKKKYYMKINVISTDGWLRRTMACRQLSEPFKMERVSAIQMSAPPSVRVSGGEHALEGNKNSLLLTVLIYLVVASQGATTKAGASDQSKEVESSKRLASYAQSFDKESGIAVRMSGVLSERRKNTR